MLPDADSNFLPPIQENDFLPPIGRWATLGGLFIVCVTGLAIPVASIAKYKETVKAEAIVRPAGELRIVQAATNGQVIDIVVKGNQAVKQGDVIATLDDSKLQTQKSQLQSSIRQEQLLIVQINAQISAINRQLKAETDRNNHSITAAQAELIRRRRDYQDKQMTTITDVKEAEASFKSAAAALNAARSKRDRYQLVAEKGALSKNQLEEAQLETQQQQQAVEATRAKVQRTLAALNPSNAEVAIASEQIAQAKAAAEANEATLDKERLTLIQQRIKIQQQLDQSTRELQQVETDLSQTVITATANGIVSKLNLRNPGQTVRLGEEIAEIVPSDASLEIKAAVATEDKSKLKLGQNVQMRVSACPYPDYGTLKGKVSQISADTVKPQQNSATATDSTTASSRNPNAATAFYEVTIKPESLTLGQGKNQCLLQLGMDGKADIISREETVLQFLLRKAKLNLGS
jgi:HlyD family type I secretion membrane fusion protein